MLLLDLFWYCLCFVFGLDLALFGFLFAFFGVCCFDKIFV